MFVLYYLKCKYFYSLHVTTKYINFTSSKILWKTIFYVIRTNDSQSVVTDVRFWMDESHLVKWCGSAVFPPKVGDHLHPILEVVIVVYCEIASFLLQQFCFARYSPNALLHSAWGTDVAPSDLPSSPTVSSYKLVVVIVVAFASSCVSLLHCTALRSPLLKLLVALFEQFQHVHWFLESLLRLCLWFSGLHWNQTPLHLY